MILLFSQKGRQNPNLLDLTHKNGPSETTSGSRREMGRSFLKAFPSLNFTSPSGVPPRNPGYGSHKLSTLKLKTGPD